MTQKLTVEVAADDDEKRMASKHGYSKMRNQL
jgi:hypothetical protein